MFFRMQLKWYCLKVAWGLIGYRDRKKSLTELKDKIGRFIELRPEADMDLIYKNIGWRGKVIQIYRRRGMSDFLTLVIKTKPHEWAIITLGVLIAAWLIYAACGGTIG